MLLKQALCFLNLCTANIYRERVIRVEKIIMDKIVGKHTTALLTAKNLDESCVIQIQQICNHPAFKNPIAIMPDAHAGKGAVIGFTMRLGEAIVPEVVGVDIGCGMLGVRLDREWNTPERLDRLIRDSVPMGFDVCDKKFNLNIFTPLLGGINRALRSFAVKLGLKQSEVTLKSIGELLDEMGSRSWYGIGSLGGGNHFIEVDRSDCGEEWLIIHSGSRNFGLKVCEKWQNVAAHGTFTKDRQKEICAEIRRQSDAGLFPHEEIPTRIKEASTSTVKSEDGIPWLEGERALGYLREMLVAQSYACLNRRTMLETILAVTGYKATETLETVHNYICADEPMTIRKGAVSAKMGERFILPLNMVAGVLICEGKGNEEWNCSAPHGAGRRMSRKEAFRALDTKRMQSQLSRAGVFTGNNPNDVLDEAPDAYKPEREIIDVLPATADVIMRMKPIHNIKAAEEPAHWQKKGRRRR